MASYYRSINHIYDESLNRWRNNFGKGTISYDSYLDLTKPAVNMIIKFLNANPNEKVIIITPNNVRSNIWRVNISTNMNKPDDFYERVELLHIDEILSKKLKEHTELLIVDYIDLYTDHYREEVLRGKYITFKFCMGLTNSVMPEKLHFVAEDHFKVIHKVTKLDLVTSNLLSNVNEHMVGISLEENQKLQYDHYSEFINETLEMYQDFDTIQKCYIGDPRNGISPDSFRQKVAESMGWNNSLDLDSEYNKSLDRYYAPSNIYERCKTFTEYVQFRRRLLTDNDVKIEAVINIIKKNIDKKILIINKRSEFATKLAKSINEKLPNNKRKATNILPLFEGGIPTGYNKNIPSRAVEYHMDIANKPMLDENTGKFITYKSGSKKGEVKELGAKSISNLNLKGFNDDKYSVLCANNTLIKDMVTEVDAIIITSPLCKPMKEHQYRVQKLDFIGEPTIITLYLNDTQEANKINKLVAKTKSNITFCGVDDINI